MNTLLRPQWLDFLDILVLSYLLHRVILLFRGTRAPQVALTLASLWGLFLVAHHYNLVMTGWILDQFYRHSVIIVIVIFRNEIREILAQSNPISLMVGLPSRKTVELPMVAEAVSQLAKDHTGALLVFQKRDMLNDLAKEGTHVDARFSPPLVLAIFSKESPIHDGAAIIRNGRIERAGTFLPLTVRDGLPTEFGTRHRAAIGLSEMSDAVVLVISEERGDVSIVEHGDVKTVEEIESLELQLLERLGVRAAGQNAQNRAINEFGQQALGFVLTLLAVTVAWIIYSMQSVSQKLLTVGVEYRNPPAQLELIEAPQQIEIQLEGKRSLVENLSKDQIRISVDLSGAERGGWYRIERGDLDIERPPGLELVSTPDISVRLGDWEVENVEIRKPELRGDPPEGFEAVIEDWQPRWIEVRMPRFEIGTTETLETRSVNLATLKFAPDRRRVEVDVPIVFAPSSARPLSGSSGRVKVIVALQPTNAESKD